MPGAKEGELKNVFTLRSLADTKAITEAGIEGKDVVVIGSSFIGIEGAIAMAGKKAKSVSVVGMEGVPLERVLGEQVGAGLQHALTENQKLHFYMKAGITKIQGSGAAESVVIKLEDGSEKTLPAQIVLLGVGVAPATEFLKDSKGFPALAKDGSVHVNADLSVKGLEGKGVYAAGDIASTPERTGSGEMRIEHWNVSVLCGCPGAETDSCPQVASNHGAPACRRPRHAHR